MKRKETDIDDFITLTERDILIEYLSKIYDNLKEVDNKEEKHSLWIIIVLLFFIILKNTHIESFSIGPITFKEISILSKILPLIFVYLLFNLKVISTHKKEILYMIKTLSEKLFNQSNESSVLPQYTTNYIIRMFLPYSFTSSISKLISQKSSPIESLLGFVILLPIIIVGIAPYIIIFYMLYDLFNSFYYDILGKICFWTTLWSFILFIFYSIKNEFKTS